LGNYNWFGTMSVAPNGRIDVVWLDTSDDPNNALSRLYYSFSEDQGDTWSDGTPLSPLFDSTVGWPNQNKMGDYFDMVSDNDYAYLAWANTINGGQDVYFSKITPGEILALQDLSVNELSLEVIPNPVTKETMVQFFLPAEKQVKVRLYDVFGREVALLFEGNALGAQSVPWKSNTASSILPSGLYFVSVELDGNTYATKAIVE